MDYELVMLRGVGYCKRKIKELSGKSENLALASFSTEGWRDGTMGQMWKLAELTAQRDRYIQYLALLKCALASMPKGYRSLLIAVYLRKINRKVICDYFGVSSSTYYRKLSKARSAFRCKLVALGCDEEWFVDNFGDDIWFRNMLEVRQNGGRMEE